MRNKTLVVSLSALFSFIWFSVVEWIDKLVIPNLSALQMSHGVGYFFYKIIKFIFCVAEVGGLVVGLIIIIVVICYKTDKGDNNEEVER